MGGDCSNPPPGWLAWTHKTTDSQAHTSLVNRLTMHLKTYGIKDTPGKQENYPLGNCSLHCGCRSLHLWPQGQPHHWPGPTGVLFLPKALRIHQVHRPPPESPVPDPLGLNVLHRGQYNPHGHPNRALPPSESDCSHSGQPEKSIWSETVSHFKSDSATACLVRAGINIFLCLQE